MWNWSENQITLVLIRHGQTQSNKEHRYLGRTDEGLSIEGEQELLELCRNNIYPKLDYLFISPMKRCIETAHILYNDLTAITIPEWREMDFGVFEGKNYMELKEDKRYQAWIDSGGTLAFPEGESREEFILRCEKGFSSMCQELCKIDKKNITVGMIVHGGTIMAVLSQYCGGDYFDYQVPNGKGYVCHLKGTETQIQLVDVKKI